MTILRVDLDPHLALQLAWGLPSGGEWIILLILGLLIFGRRLPEVGRSIGRSIVEFKRGVRGINEEIEEESGSTPKRLDHAEPRQGLSGSEARQASVGAAKVNPGE